jgi:hypothetical protein
MMRVTFLSVLRAAVICTCAFAPWVAQAQPATLPLKSSGIAQYLCGGIGVDESQALRAAMNDYPLSLLFARTSGAYLADVDVTVKDAHGATALAMRANGPVCLVDLPAGSYTVEAASEGVTKTQVVTLGHGTTKTADFRF